MAQDKRKIKWNISSFNYILIVYAIVIIFCWIYFVALQGFGSNGLNFCIGGANNVIDFFDIVILAATIASFFLVGIALLAFRRHKDNRIFILAMAFFLFALHEALEFFQNFYPGEHIYSVHAIEIIDLLIILSFTMLVYGRWRK